MNWTKRLLKPEDSPSLSEDGFDEEGNPIEVDGPACDDDDGETCEECGEEIDTGAAHVCPDCGAHLCSVECLKSHANDVHDRGVCDQCGRLFDYANLVEAEVEDDGTYRFCSRDCAKQWLEETP